MIHSSLGKVTGKIAVLGILVLGQIMLSKPAKAHAETCMEQCEIEYSQCISQCKPPLDVQQVCLSDCKLNLNVCLKDCN